MKQLQPHDADYPRSLYCLDEPPALWVSGPLVAKRVIAIVGSREAAPEATAFAHELAYHLARAGVVVASGGAVGVDRAAHVGAMKGGATWLVSPSGRDHVYPTSNANLIDRLTGSKRSRVVWPFEDDVRCDELTPRARNGVLVGLAECVVVVQAAPRSGSRNAATWARQLGRPIFVVPSAPWALNFGGSTMEILGGAHPLWSIPFFFDHLRLPQPDMDDPRAVISGKRSLAALPRRKRTRPQTYTDRPRFPVDPSTWSGEERLVFSTLSLAPTQQDTIVTRTGLSASSTFTALLTLSLKDVVVEGPDGFFRCRVAL